MLRRLDPVVPAAPDAPPPEADHPMRKVTRQVAFEAGAWTPERAVKVAALFDDLAPGWHERMSATRVEAVDDVLARGGPFPEGPCLELGSGVGAFTPRVVERFAPNDVIAADLSMEMLRRAPVEMAPRVRADAWRLPFADGSIATAVLVNMLLFPAELSRVLRAGDGCLVWVNTAGPATPIHLAADDVERALPGEWDGVHSEAGWGTWAVFRRAVTVVS